MCALHTAGEGCIRGLQPHQVNHSQTGQGQWGHPGVRRRSRWPWRPRRPWEPRGGRRVSKRIGCCVAVASCCRALLYCWVLLHCCRPVVVGCCRSDGCLILGRSVVASLFTLKPVRFEFCSSWKCSNVQRNFLNFPEVKIIWRAWEST